jgi:abhydrolase domain-containing protein 1/3
MDCNCSNLHLIPPSSSSNPYELLLQALLQIPIHHYALATAVAFTFFLYNFLEIHFIQDLFTGFSGSSVDFTYNSSSEIYDDVVSKCRILHGKYSVTPWLSSPHLQTVFLNFFGNPPKFKYKRQLFNTPDGGTIALDWVTNTVVSENAVHVDDVNKDESTPIVVIIPGLTSDSSSPYLKHLAYHTAKRGWKVVVSNHRGLGGVSITVSLSANS